MQLAGAENFREGERDAADVFTAVAEGGTPQALRGQR